MPPQDLAAEGVGLAEPGVFHASPRQAEVESSDS